MRELRFILGDQLNRNHSWFRTVEKDVLYLMVEAKSETEYVKHHIQKLISIFMAMRAFRDSLSQLGHKVKYIQLDNKDHSGKISEEILKVCRKEQVEAFAYQLPDEWRLDEELKEISKVLSKNFKIKCRVVDTEHFLTTRDELKSFFGNKQYRMEYFYRHLRKKYNILMSEENNPLGGEWNYDEKNRKRYDAKIKIKKRNWIEKSSVDLKKLFRDTPSMGRVGDSIFWPISRDESLKYLKEFISKYFEGFGPYQDAMTEADSFLFHSCISFSLNTKQISPKEVIDEAITFYKKNSDRISLATVEGFVRQILGWREFVRGIYWAEMPSYQNLNFLNQKEDLPGWMWTGNTKMNCMNHSLRQSLDLAYAHHIQRLMVIGNFMLLLGVHPDQVDEWYLGVYIDAFQWVELPNTRGMSQFADGGKLASKPYISSANYIDKMSDYCKNCFYDKSTKTEKNSCPYNSLYWDFLARNKSKFESNPRIGFAYKTWSKFSESERKKIQAKAKALISEKENL
ncbi:MAG: cryptochrome/photolyase family protein [Leptospira sp.]|nr:cryptochrome/photolyase family protein [Leptospira sp.]